MAIAHITSTKDTGIVNPLDLNLQMSHTDLHFNMKSDFSERTIYLQATTRGDNKVNKEIFVGVKKGCVFNVPNPSYEFVFDHGYAGETYGVSDIVQVFNASTSNVVISSSWTACSIDMIIFER
jgi:hypothetical protein